MKIKIVFKTPDVLDNVLNTLSENEQWKMAAVAEKFIKYGEYVTIEIDSETETARVVPL